MYTVYLLDCLLLTMMIPTIMMMTTQDITRTQIQTTTTGITHGCACGTGVEPIRRRGIMIYALEVFGLKLMNRFANNSLYEFVPYHLDKIKSWWIGQSEERKATSDITTGRLCTYIHVANAWWWKSGKLWQQSSIFKFKANSLVFHEVDSLSMLTLHRPTIDTYCMCSSFW